jgi:YVTN family beta-propeller protein
VIDTRTNAVVDTVPVIGDSLAASADGTRIYVTKYAGVSIVDTATNEVTGSVNVPEQRLSGVYTGGSRVIDVAVDPKRQQRDLRPSLVHL